MKISKCERSADDFFPTGTGVELNIESADETGVVGRGRATWRVCVVSRTQLLGTSQRAEMPPVGSAGELRGTLR